MGGIYGLLNCEYFEENMDHVVYAPSQWETTLQCNVASLWLGTFSCLRLRQWPVTYLITLSDWIMSCQPGRHAVVTVCEPDWKHKSAAYKSFDETSSFNNL